MRDHLCKPKSDGGIGFMNLRGFNEVLLRWQLMVLVYVVDSIMAKLLNDKYYPMSLN